MRLKYQLFLVLLAASALLIMLMFAISSWSFSRGFIGYLDNAEQQQLQPLMDDIVARYERSAGWQWVEGNTRAWKQLLAEHGGPRHNRRRPPGPANSDTGNPATGSAATDSALPEPRHRTAELGRKPPKGRPQFVLTDSDKRVLAGRTKGLDTISWLPLTSDGEVVGYFGRRKLTRLNSRVDQAFEYQQRKSFALAGLAMVLLSAAMSIPLAGWLVKPLLRVKGAISEVSQGNYSHRLNMKRKDEIADLAKGVNSLASTLEANREARRRWVAEISHELRTPVAVLQGELEAMQDGVRKLNVDSVDSIHTEVCKLAHLIDDLHQLSSSDVGALEYRMAPLCLADLVEAQIQIGSAVLNEAGLTVSVSAGDKPYQVSADERRLSQLISNLLQNSVRYTDAPGEIRVALDKTDEHVRLLWEDSSPGVADSELQQLFEPLYRAEQSRSREFGGAGLGLSIATRIVQAHGGSMVASQSALGGLQITITIPAAAQA